MAAPASEAEIVLLIVLPQSEESEQIFCGKNLLGLQQCNETRRLETR